MGRSGCPPRRLEQATRLATATSPEMTTSTSWRAGEGTSAEAVRCWVLRHRSAQGCNGVPSPARRAQHQLRHPWLLSSEQAQGQAVLRRALAFDQCSVQAAFLVPSILDGEGKRADVVAFVGELAASLMTVDLLKVGGQDAQQITDFSATMLWCRRLWTNLKAVEEAAKGDSWLLSFLQGPGWEPETWAREVLVACAETGFTEMAPDVLEELRQMFRCCGTTIAVEDSFGHLRDEGRQRKTGALSVQARWHRCVTSRILEECDRPPPPILGIDKAAAATSLHKSMFYASTCDISLVGTSTGLGRRRARRHTNTSR